MTTRWRNGSHCSRTHYFFAFFAAFFAGFFAFFAPPFSAKSVPHASHNEKAQTFESESRCFLSVDLHVTVKTDVLRFRYWVVCSHWSRWHSLCHLQETSRSARSTDFLLTRHLSLLRSSLLLGLGLRCKIKKSAISFKCRTKFFIFQLQLTFREGGRVPELCFQGLLQPLQNVDHKLHNLRCSSLLVKSLLLMSETRLFWEFEQVKSTHPHCRPLPLLPLLSPLRPERNRKVVRNLPLVDNSLSSFGMICAKDLFEAHMTFAQQICFVAFYRTESSLLAPGKEHYHLQELTYFQNRTLNKEWGAKNERDFQLCNDKSWTKRFDSCLFAKLFYERRCQLQKRSLQHWFSMAWATATRTPEWSCIFWVVASSTCKLRLKSSAQFHVSCSFRAIHELKNFLENFLQS